jgi:hypothetical protein
MKIKLNLRTAPLKE